MLEKMGRKMLWPICNYCTRNCLEGVKETKKVGMQDLRFFRHCWGIRLLQDATFCLWMSGFGCSEGSYCLHLKGEAAFFLDCFTFGSEDVMSLRNFGDYSPSVKVSHL